ncbi:hypothetical protein [Serratia ficaria]|uniref:Uncharacterized protein n=1 Tax=Serratia ficaria TaxID=61651 RepID=A0A240A7Q2_SERFI|nr:hypothetical protein [Serratia ficaria]REF42629.1 hypothetical protein C7332_0824 [Serratia ficaria]CAI0910992.1 Uncharacterised protein [Serratia ficaria]CAI0914154.1 Uncharacterised protein [Serratia ficaria]CAI1071107.1 Uncharacterised protein [Serratia ficaria]CAI1088384.1 Uncharacterised protein [Serratia ficaria]
MTEMNQTTTDSSITLFRNLIADLQFYKLSDIQLCDLSAVAQESAEGLCHGLAYLAESLENGEQHSTSSRVQISAWLKASAHLLPALSELSEQANNHLLQMHEGSIYQS